jgi:hypothetical protein
MFSKFKFARFSVRAFIIIALLSFSAVLPVLTSVVHGTGPLSVTDPTWWNFSWLYRKPISLTEESGSTLSNYEVKLTVDYVPSKMKSDFSDLRFTDSDQVTLIPYWIESYTASVSASVWVRVPSIPASSTKSIYMYYGNPSATSASNGTATFDFFDDFEGGSVNTSKWVTSGNVVQTNGYLEVGPGADSIAEQNTTSYSLFSAPYVLRSRSLVSTTGPVSAYVGFADSGLSQWALAPHTYVSYYTYNGVTEQNTTDPTGQTSYATYDIVWTTSSVTYYQDGVLKATHTNPPSVSMGAYLRAYTLTEYARCDWILIHKYASAVPTVAFGPEEVAPTVPLSGWQEDPLYTNASYVLSSSPSSLYLELDAVDTSSKVAIFNLNTPKLKLSSYTYLNATVSGTDNAKILLRFFLDDGSSFDVVYWGSPATLNTTRFDLSAYAARKLTGLVYVGLMSSDGKTADITITQIAFATQALPPLVPLSGWQEDPAYTSAPSYVLTSTTSSLYLELDATSTSDKVAIFNLNTPKLKLSSYTYLNATVSGTDNAKILLRFFLDDGSSFDIVYWEDASTLNSIKFDLSPYTGRTLTGLVYVALMSADGKTADITVTQIAFGTQALPPLVPLSGWQEDPAYTNASYVLTSTASSLYLELDATGTGDKVAIRSFNAPKLKLSDYTYVNVTVSGTDNARILLRFFLDNGSSFDVVRSHSGGHPVWISPADLNGWLFDLSPYTARTLTGLVYLGLMSADGAKANITITRIEFIH